eukprot:4673953-Pyramimonas_sp.AAC.2
MSNRELQYNLLDTSVPMGILRRLPTNRRPPGAFHSVSCMKRQANGIQRSTPLQYLPSGVEK